MTSPAMARVGRVQMLLLVLTCWLMVADAHALTINDILSSSFSSLSSSSADDLGGVIEHPDVDDVIVSPSSISSSSLDLSSSSDESSSDADLLDSSYVPSDFLSDNTSSSVSSSSDFASSDDTSPPDREDFPPDDDLTDEASSSVSSSFSFSSSDYYPHPYAVVRKPLVGHDSEEVKARRPPASINKYPTGTTNPDLGAKRKLGRLPSVFNAPQGETGANHREGSAHRASPQGDANGAGEPGKGDGRLAPENGKVGPSKRPGGRQWDGPPSPQRLKELRLADTNYLDLYLCGQFLGAGSTTDESSDDFAVVGFNYAGRTQPFAPCAELGSTAETVNYIYRTRREDAGAFKQIVDDLPATWLRYLDEKGASPRVVHFFTFNMPASVAEASSFLRLRKSAPYNSARFVLGYVDQPTAGESDSESARDFIDLLNEFERARIEVVRVCGRCVKAASYPAGGRRRRALQYGMSVLSSTSVDVQCRPLQELAIPGAELTSNTCDSFQKSIIRCTMRNIQRRCPGVDSNSLFSGVDTDEAFFDAINALTKVCIVDGSCWRRQGNSIRRYLAIPNQCVLPEVALGKMLERCSVAATALPFDV